jgi:hypothetical protein
MQLVPQRPSARPIPSYQRRASGGEAGAVLLSSVQAPSAADLIMKNCRALRFHHIPPSSILAYVSGREYPYSKTALYINTYRRILYSKYNICSCRRRRARPRSSSSRAAS